MLDMILKKELNEWKAKLFISEKTALLNYTSDLYEDINQELRLGRANKHKKTIELIESALKKYELSKGIEVYRYEGNNEYTAIEIFEAYSNIKKEVYLSNSFLSTSLTIEGVNNFLAYLKEEDKYISFMFICANLHKGVNCGFLDRELSYSHEEYELLLNKGCFLEHKKIEILSDDTVKFYSEIY